MPFGLRDIVQPSSCLIGPVIQGFTFVYVFISILLVASNFGKEYVSTCLFFSDDWLYAASLLKPANVYSDLQFYHSLVGPAQGTGTSDSRSGCQGRGDKDKEIATTISIYTSKFSLPESCSSDIIIDMEGTCLFPKEVKTIVNFPSLNSLQKLCKFLDLTNVYRSFIRQCAETTQRISGTSPTSNKEKNQPTTLNANKSQLFFWT